MYTGETRRTVHQRVNELRHTIKRTDLMPWNDPHTAAPSLRAWRDAESFGYECPATPPGASGVRFVMFCSGLKCGCEWARGCEWGFDFVNRGFCPTDKRGLDTEMRKKNFLPISPFSNERYLIV